MSLLVFLYHLFLLEALNCYNSSVFDLSAKSNLPESAPTDDSQRFEAHSTDLLPFSTKLLHLFMYYFFFYILLLRSWQLHLLQLLLEQLPVLCFLLSFYLIHAVFFLYVSLGCFCFLSYCFWYFDICRLHNESVNIMLN